eukprot:8188174-Alexandrium_andersonii.AAC.1
MGSSAEARGEMVFGGPVGSAMQARAGAAAARCRAAAPRSRAVSAPSAGTPSAAADYLWQR